MSGTARIDSWRDIVFNSIHFNNYNIDWISCSVLCVIGSFNILRYISMTWFRLYWSLDFSMCFRSFFTRTHTKKELHFSWSTFLTWITMMNDRSDRTDKIIPVFLSDLPCIRTPVWKRQKMVSLIFQWPTNSWSLKTGVSQSRTEIFDPDLICFLSAWDLFHGILFAGFQIHILLWSLLSKQPAAFLRPDNRSTLKSHCPI